MEASGLIGAPRRFGAGCHQFPSSPRGGRDRTGAARRLVQAYLAHNRRGDPASISPYVNSIISWYVA